MQQFYLGIDGGGSKTLALLQDLQQQPLVRLHTGPAHLTNDLAAAINQVSGLIQQLLTQQQLQAKQLHTVIGIAGAADPKLSEPLAQALHQQFQFASLHITTDAKTSLMGANLGQPVVAIALGTGSVAMRLDNSQQEQQIGGWGFSIGDEGGGAALGKAAVRATLWQVDCEPEQLSLLAKAVCQVIGQSKNQMLSWLRQANANQYAALAPVIIELAPRCPQALKVLHKHAADVELLIRATRADSQLPVVVLGGLAAVTVPYLTPQTQSWLIQAKADALAGACLLAQRWHNSQAAVSHSPAVNAEIPATNACPEIAVTAAPDQLVQQLNSLLSESRHPASSNLDQLDLPDVLTLMNTADQQVAMVVASAIPQIALLVQRVVTAFHQGGRLIYLGAGTSGRLGVLDAVECPPTFSVSDQQVMGIIAGGANAMYKAQEGAEDDPANAVVDLAAIEFGPKDVLVGIAASGRTPYVLGALAYAKQIGAYCAAISCNPDTPILQLADLAICAPVGPEILTGSTRLKSGTAQKLILNMISTASMIKTGKIYQNLMVDLHASNAKLQARAIQIVMQAVEVDFTRAQALLQQAKLSVKLAILLGKTNLPVAEAEALLATQHGSLRLAIAAATYNG